MSSQIPIGPYREIDISEDLQVPYFIIPFDKNGVCSAPLTENHLIDVAKNYSDIFVFSHGWNNDWAAATGLYESFIEGFMRMRQTKKLPMPENYRPLLVGLFWPSTDWVRSDEQAPRARTLMNAEHDEEVGQTHAAMGEMASYLDDSNKAEFYSLMQRPSLSATEGRRLASIVTPALRSGEAEIGDASGIDEKILYENWLQVERVSAPQTLGPANSHDIDERMGRPRAASAAMYLKEMSPRNILRTFTVWKMKDRAGVVGENGAGKLLNELLSTSSAKIHLIGHSYGGKVVLSAANSVSSDSRKFYSMLLLQPALTHLCLAASIPDSNEKGAYHSVLTKVERPIFTTFSSNDFPLTKVFHLALRRKADATRAATSDPPSVYAALGGFGPRRAGEQLIQIRDVLEPYSLSGPTRIYGIDGSRRISHHGDISNEATWRPYIRWWRIEPLEFKVPWSQRMAKFV